MMESESEFILTDERVNESEDESGNGNENENGSESGTFIECSAGEGYGGGIYVSVVKDIKELKLSGNGLSFIYCSARGGKNILIDGSSEGFSTSRFTFYYKDYYKNTDDENTFIVFDEEKIIPLKKIICNDITYPNEWDEKNQKCPEYSSCSRICPNFESM
jgi:hypothetical protein